MPFETRETDRSRCLRDDVVGALPDGQRGSLGVGHRLIPRLELVPMRHVGPHELLRRAAEIDVVRKASEPVRQPRAMIGASRSIEGQAPARPEPEGLGARRSDEPRRRGRVVPTPDGQPLDVVQRDRVEPATIDQSPHQGMTRGAG